MMAISAFIHMYQNLISWMIDYKILKFCSKCLIIFEGESENKFPQTALNNVFIQNIL